MKYKAIGVSPDSMNEHFVQCESNKCDGVNSNVDAVVNKLIKSNVQVDSKIILQLITYDHV